MADFAKLFVVEGIGQVLVTTGEDDNGFPAVLFRIPDAADCVLTMAISTPSSTAGDEAAQMAFMEKVFASVTEGHIAQTVRPLTDMRDKIAAKSAL